MDVVRHSGQNDELLGHTQTKTLQAIYYALVNTEDYAMA